MVSGVAELVDVLRHGAFGLFKRDLWQSLNGNKIRQVTALMQVRILPPEQTLKLEYGNNFKQTESRQCLH